VAAERGEVPRLGPGAAVLGQSSAQWAAARSRLDRAPAESARGGPRPQPRFAWLNGTARANGWIDRCGSHRAIAQRDERAR